jgi:hypothetical protein
MKLVIILVFAIIAIVRALKNAAEDKKGGQRVNANAPERRRRVQSEIDAFLTEVGAGEPVPPAQANQQKSKQQRKRRTQQRRQQQSQQQNASAASQRQAPLERQTQNSPTKERSLGSGINEHVDSYISQHVAEHIETDVDDFVEAHIVDSVESHLGDHSTELPSLTSSGPIQPTSASEFRKLLKSRSGVRQAVLLNEVLKRPSSLRR